MNCCAVLLGALAMLGVPLGMAYAESDLVPNWSLMPEWVNTILEFYGEGYITEAEMIAAIDYLVANGMIPVVSVDDLGYDWRPEDPKIADEGDFYLVYDLNLTPHDIPAMEWLREHEPLADDIAWINSNFMLPYGVPVSATTCGKGMAYSYDKGMYVCYQYVDYLSDLWHEHAYWDPEDPDTYTSVDSFISDVVHARFYQALGYALIDIYDLSYVGKEADVANQFAALMISVARDEDIGRERSLKMLYNVGNYSMWKNEATADRVRPYWDRYDFDVQQFYDISCYVYGSDPERNQDVVDSGWLPEDQAVGCYEEAFWIEGEWNRLLEGYQRFF